LDKLVGEQLRQGVYDTNDLASYYRNFHAITHYLRSKNKILEADQGRAFSRGFQPALWNRINNRLELRFPDLGVDDFYSLDDIHTAAQFVLDRTDSYVLRSHSSNQSQGSPGVQPPAPEPIKTEDMSAMFDKFTSSLLKALSNQQSQSNTLSNTSNPSNRAQFTSNPGIACLFCGLPDHWIGQCFVCEQYLKDRKCSKNAEGKIVLANGHFWPKGTPG
jgi:hypothetical protein